MSGHRKRRGAVRSAAVLFAAVLLAGILVAWEPRYWHTAVAVVALSLGAAVWAIIAGEVDLPWETMLVIPVGLWGFAQLALHATVVPSMTMRASIAWAGCLAAFVCASQILARRSDRDTFLNVLMWTITGLAALSMMQAHSVPVRVFGIIPAESSVVGTMFYKNQFAGLMELGAPLALWRVMRGRVAVGGVCYAIMFAATVTSLSRAGTILVLCELVVFVGIMLLDRGLGARQALMLAGVMLLLIAGASLVAGVNDISDRMREANPYHMREQLADSTFRMIAARPWTGFGLGTWRAVFPGYATLDMAVIANEAHNDLAQWGSEGGLPFLALVLALPLALGWRALRSVWGLGLLAVMVHCYVDYPLREPALQFVWFGLAGAVVRTNPGQETAGI